MYKLRHTVTDKLIVFAGLINLQVAKDCKLQSFSFVKSLLLLQNNKPNKNSIIDMLVV